MKRLLIKNCLECPYSFLGDGDESTMLFCDYDVKEEIKVHEGIPSWCPLPDEEVGE